MERGLRDGVVRVGCGRGFVVKHNWRGLVVTAARCLERHGKRELPPAAGTTYPNLLAALNEPPTISCECLFVDPIADVAVLGYPETNSEAISDNEYEFNVLTNSRPALSIVAAPSDMGTWVLSPKGRWISYHSAAIWPFMSGSPVVLANGAVVGLVHRGNSRLADCLPGWLLRSCKRMSALRPLLS